MDTKPVTLMKMRRFLRENLVLYPLVFISFFPDDSESEEDIPLTVANNGKPEPKAKKEKPAEIEKAKASKGKEANVGKQTVKTVQPNKEDAESSDDVVSEDDDDDSVDEGDSDDSEEEASESDEETPKKAETSKKRAPESSIKTDGKKVSGHVATPYPTKQGKTPANKPQQITPTIRRIAFLQDLQQDFWF